MTYEEFKANVIADLEEYYGKDAEVLVQETPKNNGIVHDGITIRFPDDGSVVPVIYLNNIFKLYEEADYSLDECVEEIIQSRGRYHCEDEEAGPMVDLIKDWESAKAWIVPVLVNTEKNKGALEGLVHRDFLDLSIIYMLRFATEKDAGNVTTKVTEPLLRLYGVTENEVHEAAMKNLQRDRYSLVDMETIVRKMLGDEEVDQLELNPLLAGKMYVCTNQYMMFGAAGILNEDFLRAKSNGRSFFILPSSVHETIFVLDETDMKAEYLNSMVKEVNSTQVDETEVLADHAYYYDGATGQLSIAG